MSVSTVTTYPKLAARNWWLLRNRFQGSVPTVVSPSYLSTLLNMSPDSASTNVLSPLRAVGLVDENNAPTERAYRWRDDEQYADVCGEILVDVYPQEILDLFSEASADRAQVERWFANNAGVGQGAAQKMARFYLLLVEGDPSKGESVSASPTLRKPTAPRKKSKQTAPEVGPSNGNQPQSDAAAPEQMPIMKSPSRGPSLHIDLQIHISPEASADQIDRIFESMAKHLYKETGS